MPHLRPLSTATSLCLTLAVTLAPTGPAWGAAPPPSSEATPVLVWPSDTDDPVVEIETVLTEAGYDVVPFAPVAAALRAGRAAQRERTQAKLAMLEEGLARAQEQYLAQAWDAMLEELDRLELDTLEPLTRPEGCGALWELEFRLGLGHAARKGAGDVEARTEHFALAFTLAPARRPVGDLYGPDVTAAFLAAVDTVAARPARPTTISVTPPDARVTVDCRVVDVAAGVPLSPGRHAVLVEAPGYEPHAAIVTLAAGDPVTIALHPDRTEDPVVRLSATWSSPRLLAAGTAARSAIGAVATARGAGQWIALSPTDAGTRAVLWRDGRQRVTLERAGAAAAAVAVLRPSAPRIAPPPSRDPTSDATTSRKRGDRAASRDRQPLVRRWWFWTAIAGGVAATSLGLGLGLGLPPQSSTPTRLQVTVR